MRAHDFDYRRVTDLEHALDLLAEFGGDAKVLAGGQSLLPILTMRLARPAILIDIGRLKELRYVEATHDEVRLGAGVRHWDVEAGALGAPARARLPVLGEGAALIGHHPIRTRGTVGGSLAHADPAAEWCLLARLLDARITVRSRTERRVLPAADFLRGFFTTALRPDEIVTEVGFGFVPTVARIMEFNRRHGDFPIVSVAVALRRAPGGDLDARVAFGAVGEVPVRVPEAEDLLREGLSDAAIEEAAAVACERVDPPADIHASAEYRRRLVAVLTRRSLLAVRDELRESTARDELGEKAVRDERGEKEET
ncbi:FAD binding domain-containing protein [Streptosporangium sp. NPDC051022]|uniref:FAD binding domain-containing protein n=1 Tax=Streptosporangium sp. NPDC051022 TaxID=3155752 RepID=UPI00343EED77